MPYTLCLRADYAKRRSTQPNISELVKEAAMQDLDYRYGPALIASFHRNIEFVLSKSL